jgi:hypothetical protein
MDLADREGAFDRLHGGVLPLDPVEAHALS